eukprot:TRINITY_DN3270_c0_g1_i1.p1 TRINITY_DN3270_c0_g1~~TRINITY_DN3270_c0_g1_i1.p1  ORF type:complete len:711 (-),score=156.66 TRINITY_DN3270_c0_g1_i1:34-2166(-)
MQRLGALLVANRGEIACRIARTARRLGVPTVAVFDPADRSARHVRLADRAVMLEPSAKGDNGGASLYSDADAIVQAALKAGCGWIHPGYGFLAESAAFAERCAAAGLVFVGPPAAAMRRAGSKGEARRLAHGLGVPVLPGATLAVVRGKEDERAWAAAAAEVGYPLLVKPVNSGGGKGMCVVDKRDDLVDAVRRACRDLGGFGASGEVLLERRLSDARHVEVQVFADGHGNVVHLHDRDCSLQRRFQKVAEEAPAPLLTPALREALRTDAVRTTLSAGYVGAGTLEFLVPQAQSKRDSGEYYFLEMNTRLQVEHPVTELVTGLDLVAWQLAVAAGGPLPESDQRRIRCDGHAVEARIYAEDPARGFLPSAGVLEKLQLPHAVRGRLRVDAGVVEGDRVLPLFDPMLAKLAAWGPTRAHALAELRAALTRTHVAGVATNLPLLRAVVSDERFTAGPVTTHFLGKHCAELLRAPAVAPPPAEDVALLASLFYLLSRPAAAAPTPTADPWSRLTYRWPCSGGARPRMHLSWALRGDVQRTVAVSVDCLGTTSEWGTPEFSLSVGGASATPVSVSGRLSQDATTLVSARLGARVLNNLDVRYEAGACAVSIAHSGGTTAHATMSPDVVAPRRAVAKRGAAAAAAAAPVAAPVPGRVTRLLVRVGDEVVAGQAVVVLEAMKMEHTVRASRAGRIAAVSCAVGGVVDDGAVLVVIA